MTLFRVPLSMQSCSLRSWQVRYVHNKWINIVYYVLGLSVGSQSTFCNICTIFFLKHIKSKRSYSTLFKDKTGKIII